MQYLHPVRSVAVYPEFQLRIFRKIYRFELIPTAGCIQLIRIDKLRRRFRRHVHACARRDLTRSVRCKRVDKQALYAIASDHRRVRFFCGWRFLRCRDRNRYVCRYRTYLKRIHVSFRRNELRIVRGKRVAVVCRYRKRYVLSRARRKRTVNGHTVGIHRDGIRDLGYVTRICDPEQFGYVIRTEHINIHLGNLCNAVSF